MRRDYRKWQSPALGREMELLVFGERGTPVVVFPTSMGRFYQWEDFGMVAHLRPRIDEGLMQLWCVESVDGESFYNKQVPALDRAGLADEGLLQPLRQTEFVIATGEADPNVAGSRQVVATLQDKGVPATLHLWNGWAHDWPFWKEMVDTFL